MCTYDAISKCYLSIKWQVLVNSCPIGYYILMFFQAEICFRSRVSVSYDIPPLKLPAFRQDVRKCGSIQALRISQFGPEVSISKQTSHTRTGLVNSYFMMGICLDEHLAQRRRPQWRLKKKINTQSHEKVIIVTTEDS